MFKLPHDLEVYKLAYQRALQLHKASLAWPKYEQYGGLADQIRRASKGICANIVEGLNKQGTALEERRFLGLALGSCEEVMVWLDFALDLDYLASKEHSALTDDYRKISAMIAGLMKRRSTKHG